MKLVHWPLMGWLLHWYSEEGTGRGAAITVLFCGFNVPIKGLISERHIIT